MTYPAANISPTRADIQTAIIAALKTIVPPDLEIVQGYDNQVPMPRGDHAVLFLLNSSRLATNESVFSDNARVVTMRQTMMAQIDFHGDDSAEHASAVAMLLRDCWTTTLFEQSHPEISPLYVDDPKMIPFETAEQQTERRWVVTAYFQVNQTIDLSQQTAAEVVISINPPANL